MKKKLFQYVVLYHESLGEDKYNSKIIIEPSYQLAASEKEILFKATRQISEEFISNPDNIEIIIRNF